MVGLGFGVFFNSSRVEEEAFAHLQFVAFITSTIIRVCRDTSVCFFFFFPLQFLNTQGYSINF